jgi:hypothetical protein
MPGLACILGSQPAQTTTLSLLLLLLAMPPM